MVKTKLIKRKEKKPQKKFIDWYGLFLIISFILLLVGGITWAIVTTNNFQEAGQELCAKNNLQFKETGAEFGYCYETEGDLMAKYPIEKIDDKYYMVIGE